MGKPGNTVKIPTLTKDYSDQVERLLHASFTCLVEFVEKEKPGKIINWSHDKWHRSAWKEIQSLYKWWKTERPKREKLEKSLYRKGCKFKDEPNFPVPGKPGFTQMGKIHPKKKIIFAKLNKLERVWDAEDERNLIRLAKIRQYLWT